MDFSSKFRLANEITFDCPSLSIISNRIYVQCYQHNTILTGRKHYRTNLSEFSGAVRMGIVTHENAEMLLGHDANQVFG